MASPLFDMKTCVMAHKKLSKNFGNALSKFFWINCESKSKTGIVLSGFPSDESVSSLKPPETISYVIKTIIDYTLPQL